MIIRSPRPQAGKIVFSDAKRLLQHYPAESRHTVAPRVIGGAEKFAPDRVAARRDGVHLDHTRPAAEPP
jgi:hypothetical protein